MTTRVDQMIIAEIGSVHDGSFGNAMRLIEAAAAAGASAVKFQTHIAEAETLRNAPMPPYFSGEPRYEYFQRTAFSPLQWSRLAAQCHEHGVQFLSSPFSEQAVDLLETVGVEAYKIPSGEVTNIPLLRRVAATGKAVLLSSGMSSWDELDAAVAALTGRGPLCVMQCTSAYPCPPDRVGLNVLAEVRARYPQAVLGFSDHTMGSAAAFAAAALGARVIEKHFTYSRLMYGSDARHSMEPREFQEFAAGVKEIWAMLCAPVDKGTAELFQEMKLIFQKSIVTRTPVPEGTTITREHLAFKKPGDGIAAARYEEVLGRRAAHDLAIDHKLVWDDLS